VTSLGNQIPNDEMFVNIQIVHGNGKTEAPIWKHLSKVMNQIPHETIEPVRICAALRVHPVKRV
jgi:hypothetical protein